MEFARPGNAFHAACAAPRICFNAQSRNSTGNRKTQEADEDGQDGEMEELWWKKKMIEEGLRGCKQGKGDRWCEGGGMQRPATGGDGDGLILQEDD